MLLWDFLPFDLANASTNADVPATPGAPGEHCIHLCSSYWIPPPTNSARSYTLTIICLQPIGRYPQLFSCRKNMDFSIMQTKQEASLKFKFIDLCPTRENVYCTLGYCSRMPPYQHAHALPICPIDHEFTSASSHPALYMFLSLQNRGLYFVVLPPYILHRTEGQPVSFLEVASVQDRTS